MTQRLYYSDSYLTHFSARVAGRSDDGRAVWLDQTAFYPTSGGQPHDTGTLAGICVVDVTDDGDRIIHHLEDPLPELASVQGVVDWPRRFDHMQQHTGQHLLSAILADVFLLETVSVHFGADSSTLDVAAATVPESTLRALEERANAAIHSSIRVSADFEDSSAATGLRKPSDRTGMIRVVTIEGLDRSACGGTHCTTLGAVGLVLVRSAEKSKGQTRIEFLCGMRAVRRARADHELLRHVATALSTATDDVPTLVAAKLEELKAITQARRAMSEQLSRYRASELVAAAGADADGLRRVRAEGSTEELRLIAQAATSRPSVRFIGVSSSPPTILLALSADVAGDAAAELTTLLVSVGGRGGGSARLAQGTVPTADLLSRVSAQL